MKNEIKKINLARIDTEETGNYYLTNDGDLVDTIADAEVTGHAIAEVIVDGFFVGSLDDAKKAARGQLIDMGIIFIDDDGCIKISL